MTNKTITAVTAVVTVFIASVVALCGMCGPDHDAYAQAAMYYYVPPQNTISVTGTATDAASPDLVVMQLGADTQAKTAQEAMVQNAQIMNATTAAIENLGIPADEIGTINFQIQPVYNNTGGYLPYGKSEGHLLGYRVSNTLLIKTAKLGLAGAILDTAVSEGANRVDTVTFTLSPAKMQSEQNSLISQAVVDAQNKAQKALAPLNEKIVGVKSVNLAEIRPQPLQTSFAVNQMIASPSVQTPILASSQEITTSVDVVFLIGTQ